jgi:hypothetical protein
MPARAGLRRGRLVGACAGGRDFLHVLAIDAINSRSKEEMATAWL